MSLCVQGLSWHGGPLSLVGRPSTKYKKGTYSLERRLKGRLFLRRFLLIIAALEMAVMSAQSPPPPRRVRAHVAGKLRAVFGWQRFELVGQRHRLAL